MRAATRNVLAVLLGTTAAGVGCTTLLGVDGEYTLGAGGATSTTTHGTGGSGGATATGGHGGTSSGQGGQGGTSSSAGGHGGSTTGAGGHGGTSSSAGGSGGTSSSAGGSGGTSSSAGGSGAGGQGVQCGGKTCDPPKQPACEHVECLKGACTPVYEAEGTKAPGDVVGDCNRPQCDGHGGIEIVPDDKDVASDGIDCTSDVCSGGKLAHPSASAGTKCNQGGGKICDGAGNCVECNDALDCQDAAKICDGNTCKDACGAGEMPCGGVCADLLVSPLNCGACGHSCLGEPCIAGLCPSVAIASVADVNDAGTAYWQQLVVDDTYAYIANSGAQGSLDSVDLATGAAARVDATASVTSVALQAPYVYYATSFGNLKRWNRNDGKVSGIRNCQAPIGQLAVDVVHLYWAYGGVNEVWRASLDGAGAQKLVSAPASAGVAVTSAFLLFDAIDGGSHVVDSVSLGGGQPTLAYPADNTILPLTADGDLVFFGVEPGDGGIGGRIVRVDPGKLTVELRANRNVVTNVAAKSSQLYWGEDPGPGSSDAGKSTSIVRLAADNSGSVLVLTRDTARPLSVAVNSKYVYYTTGTELRRVAK